MRCLTFAVIIMAAGIVTPCLGEDSYLQTWHPLGNEASARASANAPT